MSQKIQDKVVVMTGASSGMGEVTARYLNALDAKVVLETRLKALVAELTAQGGDAIARTVDVTKKDQAVAVIDAAVERFGRMDILINDAGLMSQSRKHAVRAISEGLPVAVKAYSLRTTVISPGTVATELTKHY